VVNWTADTPATRALAAALIAKDGWIVVVEYKERKVPLAATLITKEG
jgi:hypothetical protein